MFYNNQNIHVRKHLEMSANTNKDMAENFNIINALKDSDYH